MTLIRAMKYWSGNVPGLEIPFTYICSQTPVGSGTIPGAVLRLGMFLGKLRGAYPGKSVLYISQEKFYELLSRDILATQYTVL